MELDTIITLVNNFPMLVLSLVLLNREMKKREAAEDRERALLNRIAGLRSDD